MFTSVRSRRTAARLTLGLGLALASAGCGGGGGGGDNNPDPTGPNPPGQPSNPSTQPATTATVTMRSQAADGYYSEEHSFSPAQVNLKRGGTVTWNNTTGMAHNVTFAAAQGAPANVEAHTNGSTARTFNAVGAFDYQCTNHPGMSGKVTVVD